MAVAAASPSPADPPLPSSDRRRGGRHTKDSVPFDLAKDSDRIRVKLRETAMKLGRTSPLDSLPTVPGVHALALATRYIDGGRQRFLEFIQMAMLNGNAHAEAFLLVYADLSPSDRMKVSFDDVCAAAGVRPADLMSAVVSAAMEYGTDVGNLVAAALHPGLVHQAGKSAKRIGGEFAEIAFKDRLLLLQAAKFAPVPKGASVHVHASANAAAATALSQEASVPSFSADLASLGAAKRVVQQQLTEGPMASPVNATDIADAELVDA